MIVVEWRQFSTGDLFDITDRINLNGSAFSVTENAEELTVGASTLVIDDPDGDFDIGGHNYVRVRETEAPDEGILWAGFATIRHIKRDVGFMTGAARTWTANLDDVNTAIARRILSEGNDADRPAETDVERIQWLVDENFISDLGGRISTANPVDMDAANCIGMGVYDVINDCMLQSGKNCFQQDVTIGLDDHIPTTFYDFASSTQLQSDLQISNYNDDITAEVGAPSPMGAAQTWAASLDTDMERDPTRVYWKVRGQYDGGTVTRTRPATAVNFAARETTASWPLVKTATIANARADRYLLDISTEEDVITTTIWVHPAHVNDARAGWKVQARFSHLPGYEDWTWMRILNRTVTFETPEVYRIQYTLSPDAPAAPPLVCGVVAADITILDGGLEGPAPGPFIATPATPATDPSMIMGCWMISEGTGFLLGSPVAIDSPWTLMDAYDTTSVHSFVGVGYLPFAGGTPAGLSIGDSGTGGSGGPPNSDILTFDFATAETSPVQFAHQFSVGALVTFGATPTPGNIIISYEYTEDATAAGTVGTGFTLLYGVARSGGNLGLNGVSMTVSYRCVEVGDDDTYDIGYLGSFTHHTIMSEWALTA